jgi:hypothetical protein
MQKALGDLGGRRESCWTNLGGQPVCESDLQKLLSEIKSGRLKTWNEIHHAYDLLWQEYPQALQRHAFAVLCSLFNTERLNGTQWAIALKKAEEIQETICERVYLGRKKDFDNPFRKATFADDGETDAVVGTVDDDDFVKKIREETSQFKARISAARKKTM